MRFSQNRIYQIGEHDNLRTIKQIDLFLRIKPLNVSFLGEPFQTAKTFRIILFKQKRGNFRGYRNESE